ncbi:MAG: hypothetical protein CBC65_000870 [Rhodothermaceae bacterium TMED105]|jgi:hypothetical protein|nr:MAG: hypothetical protein CBC65_000870 [Rhodothermaceae bacterium TMED105]|tara:strand:- start:1205 stop:1447 length:243 start_codon:yes stop_codon:yes gene_type:complete
MNESLFVSSFQVKELEHNVVSHQTLGNRHVYVGLCDGVLTKWVTFSAWDGKLRLVEGVYKDTKGREILVFEDDEDEWDEW